jgi:Doubled CXXCH motif (Paired_CXXCH_1)
MPRIANLFFAVLLCLFASMALAALWQSGTRANMRASCATDAQVSQASARSNENHPVIIRKPAGPPRIELAGYDPQGRIASVACSTCHSVRQANLENKTAATVDEFHQGMSFNHGNITCYACHNPNESDALRLADGSSITYENVMTLCSQCHSKQAESFAHGAHGGMNGHWDLSRGPQMKNNCIDCHDPHVPKYPKMIVGFKPKDRFNEPSNAEHQQERTAAHDKH